VAKFCKEAVVPIQQEQVQLPTDWNAFHVHLHEQCSPSTCRSCQGASKEGFDRGPIREYLVPAHHPFVLKVLLINVDDVHKGTNWMESTVGILIGDAVYFRDNNDNTTNMKVVVKISMIN